jgi:hypothetical protein
LLSFQTFSIILPSLGFLPILLSALLWTEALQHHICLEHVIHTVIGDPGIVTLVTSPEFDWSIILAGEAACNEEGLATAFSHRFAQILEFFSSLDSCFCRNITE